MNSEPQKQHEWLKKLVGEWTVESDCSMGADTPAEKFTGVDKVRQVGGLWVVCEGQADMPGGAGPSQSIMTLGFDPQKDTYVGTFIASMMSYLWVYDSGTVDATGKKLTLDAVGPDFSAGFDPKAPFKPAKYQDIIEFLTDDHRTLTGKMLGPDGKWTTLMTAHYRRKK